VVKLKVQNVLTSLEKVNCKINKAIDDINNLTWTKLKFKLGRKSI